MIFKDWVERCLFKRHVGKHEKSAESAVDLMPYNRPLKYEIEATRFAQRHGLDGVFFGVAKEDGSEVFQAGFFDEADTDGFTGGWYTPFDDMLYDVIADETGVRWRSDSHRSFPQSSRNPNVPDA